VSFDVNHRPSLWRSTLLRGGHASIFEEILRSVDVLFSNYTDVARAASSWELEDVEHPPGPKTFQLMIEAISSKLPRLRLAATPVRTTHSASRNAWGGIGWSRETGFEEIEPWESVEIFDRVGGGDAFAAGFIYGSLTACSLQRALGLAIAHGALVMSTPGDTSSATLAEVQYLADGGAPVTNR
jgi:2-dehydro-3-deoxygluconokinase